MTRASHEQNPRPSGPHEAVPAASSAPATGPVPEVGVQPPEHTRPARELNPRLGYLCALGAYGIWSFLPLYFHALKDIPPLEMLAWRIVFSLVLCVVFISATRTWGRVRAAFLNVRVNLTLALAGAVVSVNWLSYIVATTTGHVLEASLGYFINPLASILLGVIVLREKLRKLQWAAVVMGVLAVGVITVNYGTPPWLSLVIAGSFALYGLVKNRLGGRVDSLTGLSFETAWLFLPAVAVLCLQSAGTLGGGGLAFASASWGTKILLLCAGPVTLFPLLFFAGAASNLPLSTVGMFQYMTPIIQFLIGWAVFGEEMSPARWVGFAAVWLAVIMLLVDAVRATGLNRRAARRARAAEAAGGGSEERSA